MGASVSLKLVVDKEKNRVVFAEADKDFVDMLFSFLTLPLGTIVRLLNKQSGLGCLDKLYESVEKLEEDYFETKACKVMLLQPRCAAEELLQGLVINLNDQDHRKIYVCSSQCMVGTRFGGSVPYSYVSGATCHCGKLVDKPFCLEGTAKADVKDGVFVKAGAKFIITDDLYVSVSRTSATRAHLEKLSIKDTRTLEERTIILYSNKVLHLLSRMLRSVSPLTDVFLREKDSLNVDDGKEIKAIGTSNIKLAGRAQKSDTKKVDLNCLIVKDTGKLMYAEAKQDFVDVLFSFLTFPLGTVVHLLQGKSSIVCLDNLYQSVKAMGVGDGGIKSEEYLNILLKPKIYAHFDCNAQIIGLETVPPRSITRWPISCCEANPKLPNLNTKCGGNYAKSSAISMVTNDLVVSPLSAVHGLNIIKELSAPFSNLKETRVTIGEAEALKLLQACLVSQSALGDALFTSYGGKPVIIKNESKP